MLAQLKANLLSLGFTAEQLQKAGEAASTSKGSLMTAVETLGVADQHKVLAAFGAAYKMPITNLPERDIPPNIIELIPRDIASRYRVIPIERVANNILLAMAAPIDIGVQQSIEFKTKSFVKPVLANEQHIVDALLKYYGGSIDMTTFNKPEAAAPGAAVVVLEDSRIEIGDSDNKGDGPVIQLVNDVLQQCLTRGASDIHIEPFEKYVRIRLRIDGDLIQLINVPIQFKNNLITRVKIMSKLVITETRKPQDGNIRLLIAGKPVDFRVNAVPTTYGEKIVMRILDKSALQVDMLKLGFDKEDLRRFKEAIQAPYGMVLVTGPTGSGKTTTLYSALAELNKIDTNVMTAEDPVEYTLDGVNQVHVRPEYGMTFADALKAFLRQDPDVIMVGEIRDLETAEIAVKAALTGHLLLSTLHTNSATETISRLLNMGVEPFNVVSALTCVVAQRLVRKICEKCKIVDETVTTQALIELGVPEQFAGKHKAYKGAGCPNCRNTGQRGRAGIHEVLIMTDQIKRAVLDRKPILDIKIIAMESGMKSLRQSALIKMTQGIISAEEVANSTVSDSDPSSAKVKEAG
ncbi:MAG: ATPase, T2SS/T4P/T4SS family [Proteobacteria bacterium]|nr:ATPase, T2SS/T4P/T4SS family [Pseudomonadota bacterium]